jgi:hypothetical protein
MESKHADYPYGPTGPKPMSNSETQEVYNSISEEILNKNHDGYGRSYLVTDDVPAHQPSDRSPDHPESLSIPDRSYKGASLTKTAKAFRDYFRSKEDEMTPLQKALLASGVTSAGYAIPKSMKEQLLDELERRTPPMTMEEVIHKVRPGDVFMSRVPAEASADIPLKTLLSRAPEDTRLPLKTNEIIQLILGTPYTHASMKMEHGNDILNVMMDPDKGAKMENLEEALRGSEFKIYRPYGLTHEQYRDAIEGVGSLKGKPYRPMKDIITTGLHHILNPVGTKTNISKLCEGNQTCMSAIGNAYPHIFPTEETVADTIRSTPHMEFIGRYNPGGIVPSAYERFATKVVSPILKSMKYALPAGAATYLYQKLKDRE